MGDQRRRTRISSKIDELPEDLKAEVDEMLFDTSITYQEISDYLAEKDYDISKSSVGRYALRRNAVGQRLMEAQQQTKALISAVKKNPDLDYTDAGMQILMDSLVKRISTAQEEFDELPLDKAGRLIAALSRTAAYKEKVKQDLKDKAEIAFKQLEKELMAKIKSYPDLASELKQVLEKAKSRMIEDD